MEEEPVNVSTYSGYKVDEYPLSFHWKGRKHIIREIVDRWQEYNINVDWLSINYFKVSTSTDMLCLLKHDIETDLWYLVKVFPE